MLVECGVQMPPKDVILQKRPEEREQGVREGCLVPPMTARSIVNFRQRVNNVLAQVCTQRQMGQPYRRRRGAGCARETRGADRGRVKEEMGRGCRRHWYKSRPVKNWVPLLSGMINFQKN